MRYRWNRRKHAPLSLDQSEMDIMRSGLARIGLALVAVLSLASAGCQEDNEAAIKQQERASSGAEVKGVMPQPRSADQRDQQNKAIQPTSKSMGYPGTNKRR